MENCNFPVNAACVHEARKNVDWQYKLKGVLSMNAFDLIWPLSSNEISSNEIRQE